MKKIIMASVLMMLAGCVSTSQEDLAQEGDWRQIGYQDGIRGHTERSFSQLSKLGSVVMAEYDEGYLEGVAEYCNPNHAYMIGLSGQPYEGVCEGMEDAQQFRMEWQRGWNEYSN
ncbi:DUF2799 domain-containing protein [Vibrio sp. SCSIO 43135]|uniref:DUF2799 domain-containing protein n=1 Tax=Vibrio sp. SCSIO 43135 TaxID=2819096 RepID=UPI002076549F|nr:DUF2799 domain-containing protein [Vibrio sp. SCSIO 43135]USD41689.1 DUF2799 domain-containing protein [Vibrio sp. SCSIO 43135]